MRILRVTRANMRHPTSCVKKGGCSQNPGSQVARHSGLGGRSREGRKNGTSRVASSSNLPVHKTEGIDISTFKGVKVLHVDGFIKYFRGHVSATAKEMWSCMENNDFFSDSKHWFKGPLKVGEPSPKTGPWGGGSDGLFSLQTPMFCSHSLLFFFKVFAKLHGMWGLSSPIRDQTCATCNEGQIPWTSRGVPVP